MNKYKHLLSISHKKYNRYWEIKKLDGCVSIGWGPHDNVHARIYENDDFEIIPQRFIHLNTYDLGTVLSCLPFGLIKEKRRSGWYINNVPIQGIATMRFNKNGDCINNNIVDLKDTEEKRKKFNAWMLHWQRMFIAYTKMNYTLSESPNQSLDNSCTTIFESHMPNDESIYKILSLRYSYWSLNGISTEKRIASIKHYRKTYSPMFYIRYLEGECPYIDTFEKPKYKRAR